LPNSIKFTNYRLSDSQNNILLESDFSIPLIVKPSLLGRVIGDLTGFTVADDQNEFSSQLKLTIDGEAREINRNGSEVDGGKAALSEVVGNEASDKDSLLKVLPNILTAMRAQSVPVQPDNPEAKAIVQQLVELGGEQLRELIEVKTKIRELEAQLSGQRRIDELQMSSSNVLQEISNIDEKLESVNQLAERQKQIEIILARYGKFLQADLENEGQRLKTEISALRTGELVQAEKAKPKVTYTETVPKRIFLGKPLLGLAIASAVIGTIAFLVLRDNRILILGFTFALLEVGILLIVNLIPAAVATEVREGSVEAKVVSVQRHTDHNRISLMERFFVDKAWVNALRTELQSIANIMKGRLGTYDYAQLQQLRELVQTEFQTIKSEVEAHKNKEIPPEDYLRKRREVDTLKIQRSRLDAELAREENYDEIRELIEDWEDAQSSSQASFVASLTQYADIVAEKGSLLAVKTETAKPESVDFTAEDLLAIYVWLRLDSWSKSPVKPLIFVTNLLNQVSTKAQAAINARIVELTSRGQIIPVTINT